MGSSSGRRSGLRLFLVLLGAGLLIAGVWVLADRYSADYDCFHVLTCHNEGSRSPSASDRVTVALGFGVPQPGVSDDELPGPWGTMLVAGGLAVLFAAMFVAPRNRGGDGRGGAQPMSIEQQLERYERLHERGTLSDEEFEARRDRLLGQRRAPRPYVERSS